MKRILSLVGFLVLVQLSGVLFCSEDKAKLKEQLSAAAPVAGDMTYESKYAYSILVPQSYQYKPSDQASYGGVLSLVAIKDHGNGLKSVVTVLAKKRQAMDFFNPRNEIEAIAKDLKAKDPNYIFDQIVADKEKGRCDYRGKIKGYDMNGIIVVVVGKEYSYQIGLISYDYQKAKPDFERIIQSFKVAGK